MTSTASLMIAFCLLINDMTILRDDDFLGSKYVSSCIVFLLSNCMLLRRLNFFPLRDKFHPVSCFIEIPIALLLLEASLIFVWNAIQRSVLRYSNDILIFLTDDLGLQRFTCFICYDERNCTEIFAILMLKLYSSPGPATPRNQQASVYRRPASRRHVRSSRFDPREMQRNRIERSSSKRWRGSVRRIFSAAAYNLSCFTHGCSTGWVSGVLGREALAGGAWLAALPSLVALPAAPFFAVLADAKGRRAGALCICISFILSWSLAAWCGSRGVWAARIAAGVGGAGALVLAPLYGVEISPKTKGLAAMPALACSCGVLFAYVGGGLLSAHTLSLCMAAPPAVLLVLLAWLPESPSFLISVGRMQDAAKVICWLDGSDFREDLTEAIEQQEVMIRTEPARRGSDALQPMLRRSRSEGTSEGREISMCRDLFRHRRSRRALISCCLLVTAAAGSGAGAVNSFAAALLTHSGHALPSLNLTAYNMSVYDGSATREWRVSSETGPVLCGTALVLGAAVAIATVDKVGRKVLLLTSGFGIAFCLTFLGAYCDPHLRTNSSLYQHRLWPFRKTTVIKEKTVFYNITASINNSLSRYTNDSSKIFKIQNDTLQYVMLSRNVTERTDVESIWPPVIILSVVVFLYNVGLGSVPYVLVSELFSINVRSLASSLLIAWMWLNSFLTLRYFNSLAVTIGLHSTYYIGASITLMVSGYTFLVLPETKGKNQKQIDDLLDGPILIHLKKRRKVEEP